MPLNFTFWMGILYLIVAIARAFGAQLNIIVVIGISVSAVLLSVRDLLDEIHYRHLKKLSIIISALVVAFILLPALFNLPVSDRYKDNLTAVGDVATIIGLGIVLITIGLKNSRFIINLMKNYEKLTLEKQENANPQFNYQVVKMTVTQEYKTMISINDTILELKKRDQSSLNIGRPHDGWSLFYDTLEGFQVHGGPFYDLLLDRLFWEFATHISVASNHFSQISDADLRRTLGHVLMWGTKIEVHYYGILPNHAGFSEGEAALKEAIKVWDDLKENATRLYEKHGIHEYIYADKG